MNTWECTNKNPPWNAKGKCGADVSQRLSSVKKPSDKCPNCGKKQFWQQVIVPVAVAPAPVLAWPNPLPVRLDTALQGNFVTAENNTAGDLVHGTCNTTYGGGKHWGGTWDAGQYDISQIDSHVVLGLETKAVRIGLPTAGGCLFCFSFDVGHTCKKNNAKGLAYEATPCIRVDGGVTVALGMHSHPIPQWGSLNTSSHEKEVKSVIIDAVNKFDVVGLAEVAEYLTLIKATHDSYKFSAGEKLKLANPLPPSVYW